MSVGIANKLQAAFPCVQVLGGMSHPGKLKVADGWLLPVEKKTCPVRIELGDTHAKTCVPNECRHRDIPTVSASHRQFRPFAEQTSLTPEEPDEAAERFVVRGPDIDMSPEAELRAKYEALNGAVQAAAAAGLRHSSVECLRVFIGGHWNAFRRGLRKDDMPALVEPLCVTPKPRARPVKARPSVYNPVRTACSAACMAALVALGLVFLNLKAVWASEAMATPQKGGLRMVSDLRALNQQLEKVPGVIKSEQGQAE